MKITCLLSGAHQNGIYRLNDGTKFCTKVSYVHTCIYMCNYKKQDNFEMESISLTLNISANSWSNLASKDSFKISSSWGFRYWPWLKDLIKIRLRYWGLKRRLPFPKIIPFLLCLYITYYSLTGQEIGTNLLILCPPPPLHLWLLFLTQILQ